MKNLELKNIIKNVSKKLRKDLPELQYKVFIRKTRKNIVGSYKTGSISLNNHGASVSINANIISIIEEIECLLPDDPNYDELLHRHIFETISHELVHAIQEYCQVSNGTPIRYINFDEDEAEFLCRNWEAHKTHPLILNFKNIIHNL